MILGSPNVHQRLCKDDEDEGSLLQGRANPGEKYREKIECSADALRGCHNPAFFPSEYNPALNALRVTGKTKVGKRQITDRVSAQVPVVHCEN
jgi:hypothetical protein